MGLKRFFMVFTLGWSPLVHLRADIAVAVPHPLRKGIIVGRVDCTQMEDCRVARIEYCAVNQGERNPACYSVEPRQDGVFGLTDLPFGVYEIVHVVTQNGHGSQWNLLVKPRLRFPSRLVVTPDKIVIAGSLRVAVQSSNRVNPVREAGSLGLTHVLQLTQLRLSPQELASTLSEALKSADPSAITPWCATLANYFLENQLEPVDACRAKSED